MSDEPTEYPVGIDVPPSSARNGLLLLPPMPNPYVLGLASAELVDVQLRAELAIALGDSADGDRAPPEVVDAVASLIVQMLGTTNSQFFRFDLTSALEPGEPRVRRLGPGSHPLADESVGDVVSTRKLTLLLPLLVPEELVARIGIASFGKDRDLEAGAAYVMPSYLAPLVTFGESGLSDDVTETGDPEGAEVLLLVSHAIGPVFH